MIKAGFHWLNCVAFPVTLNTGAAYAVALCDVTVTAWSAGEVARQVIFNSLLPGDDVHTAPPARLSPATKVTGCNP